MSKDKSKEVGKKEEQAELFYVDRDKFSDYEAFKLARARAEERGYEHIGLGIPPDKEYWKPHEILYRDWELKRRTGHEDDYYIYLLFNQHKKQ